MGSTDSVEGSAVDTPVPPTDVTRTAPELLPTRPSLLARLRNLDDSQNWQAGWEEFFALYHPVIYRRALKAGLVEADAEDVVQDIVIGIARKLPTFHYDPQKGSFKTWLFRIVRNKIVDHLRRRGRQNRGPLVAMAAELDAELPVDEVADEQTLSPDREWDLAWETNLRRAALDHVAQRVNPMTMRIYLYHVVDGHTVAETVEHFRESRVAEAAVHLAKHRVKKMLDRKLLELRENPA